MVPEDIKKSGKLVVGVNLPYPPNEFKDPRGKIIGFDVDLMDAVATTLGLTAEYREADFAKIIPSIQGGTFNVGMSSFTDNQERQQSVDFVDYFNAGSLGAAARARDRSEQCDTARRSQSRPRPFRNRRASRQSKACTEAGKPPSTS